MFAIKKTRKAPPATEPEQPGRDQLIEEIAKLRDRSTAAVQQAEKDLDNARELARADLERVMELEEEVRVLDARAALENDIAALDERVHANHQRRDELVKTLELARQALAEAEAKLAETYTDQELTQSQLRQAAEATDVDHVAELQNKIMALQVVLPRLEQQREQAWAEVERLQGDLRQVAETIVRDRQEADRKALQLDDPLNPSPEWEFVLGDLRVDPRSPLGRIALKKRAERTQKEVEAEMLLARAEELDDAASRANELLDRAARHFSAAGRVDDHSAKTRGQIRELEESVEDLEK